MHLTDPPQIETKRLRLRGLTLADAPAVQQLAGQREISHTMISVPHPYPLEQVQAWIASHEAELRSGHAVHWGLQLRSTSQLIGAIELRAIDPEHAQAELSFWVGVVWWRHGYASEAAQAVVRFGFENLQLNRIYAHHMVRNPASGRVLQRLGMRQEGLLRQRVRKWDLFEDVLLWAILRQDLPADVNRTLNSAC